MYVNLIGGQTFVATSGAPDFVEHNSSVVTTFSATGTLVATFDATSTGSGGGVDTLTNRITTLAAHGFTDGDPVQYNPGSDPALGGLTTNNVYYVKVINSTTIELYNNYDLTNIMIISTSTGSGHTLTRKAVDIVNNTFTVPGHGFVTGDAFRILGSDLPYESGVQISQNTFWFVGSVTTNSFTVHALRADALSSIAGVVLGSGDLTATGSGNITVVKANIKIIGTVNTSSTIRDNWNSLTTTNIDASNIISGIVATSRLATGTANNTTFLRGDSTWSTVVQSAQVATNSALTLTGSGSSPYYNALTFDVVKANSTGAVANYTSPGVASFNTTQFRVGTGDSLGDGQVLIRDGVIDAGTLQTRNLAYVLDSANHTTQPVSLGGTGLITYTVGDTLYASATTTLNKLGIGVANTVMTSTGSAPQWSSGLTLAEDISLNGTDVITTSTAGSSLFNTNTKTLNIGGAAGSIALGNNTATEAITTNIKSYTTNGSALVTVTANIGLNATISTVARNGSNVATIVTTANHGLTTGDVVTIVCTSDTGFNTVQTAVTVSNATTFTYANTGSTVTTVAGSGTVFIGAVGMSLGTAGASSNTWLAFATSPISAGVRAGMLVQGSANIPAGTVVTGLDANRVYLSAALTGTVTSTSPIAFTDTNTSLGIRVGDTVTVAASGDANINGTWPVSVAGANAITFTFNITTATTQTNLARVGTIVRNNSLLIRNPIVSLGSAGASASPVAVTVKGEDGIGTNIAGAALTIRSGLATGNAASGRINFQTGTTGSAGTTAQAAVTRMYVDNSSTATSLNLETAMTTANVFNNNATSVAAFASATTLQFAGSGTGARTISVATNATGGASTLTFGGAVTGNILKINSVAAGTVSLTSDVTTGTVNIYAGTTTGTINIGTTGATGSTVKTGTTTVVNDQLYITSNETAGITTTPTAVSSFATATYRSAKFTVQVECTAGTDVGKYQVSEILLLQDGTTATLTDYAVIRTGNNLVTFTADISAPNARLLATATAGNTIKVRVVRYLNTI